MRNGQSEARDWAFLAMAHARKGRLDEAKKWLERLAAFKVPDSPDKFWEEQALTRLARRGRDRDPIRHGLSGQSLHALIGDVGISGRDLKKRWRRFAAIRIKQGRAPYRVSITDSATNEFMTDATSDQPDEETSLLHRAAAGDQEALRAVFTRYRDRLKRMVQLRLSRRLTGRVDDSDVVQESFLDVSRRLDEYLANPSTSFFLWLRNMTALKMAEVHRRHLGTQLRDAGREVTLHRGGLPMADSVSLAAQLLGKLTAPSQAAIKAETRLLVQEALNSMDPIDREVLALKHFEQLSTTEIAEVLGLSKAGAGSRYLRAIKRLREILQRIPGFDQL